MNQSERKAPSRKPYKRNCDACHRYYEGRGAKACSRKCSNTLQWSVGGSRKKGHNHPTLTCKICLKIYQSTAYWKGRQTCSPACTKIARVRAMTGQPNWTKPEGYKTEQGYLMLFDPERFKEHGSQRKAYIMEHRLVMEKHLGRRLTSNELVHHRNGIKNDNRPENLEIVIRKAHMGEVMCPHCQKKFQIK